MGSSNTFKKIDADILKKMPFQWIIGWHIFIPLIFILGITGLAISFLTPVQLYTYSTNSLIPLSIFLGFLSLILTIFYIVRQIKFNSFRIHHHLPYSRSIVTYFSFWFLMLLFVIIPFISYEAYTLRVQNKVNSITENLEEDIHTLDEGLAFFYSNKKYSNDYQNPNLINIEYFEDNIIINKSENFTYYEYVSNPQNLSNSDAINRIKNFIQVAERYDIELKDKNPLSIFEKRKNYNLSSGGDIFSLLKIDPNFPNNAYQSYSNMLQNYLNSQEPDTHEFYFIILILIFSAILALLLWIIISVAIADFGFAILASSLIALFVGILSAIITMINPNVIFLFLYFIFLLIFLVAFINFKQTRLKRIFQIVSQINFPILVGIIIIQFFESINHLDYEVRSSYEKMIPFVLLIAIVSTVFVYKYVYRSSRIIPK